MDAQDLILFVLFRGSKEFSVTEKTASGLGSHGDMNGAAYLTWL